jgi:hypothetical protein
MLFEGWGWVCVRERRGDERDLQEAMKGVG